MKHAACEKGIDIQKENDGPCKEKVGDDDNGNSNKHSEAFDTTGDGDEGENSQEDDEILRDSDGNKDCLVIIIIRYDSISLCYLVKMKLINVC